MVYKVYMSRTWQEWLQWFRVSGNFELYYEYQKAKAIKLGCQYPCKDNILYFLDRQGYNVLTPREEYEWQLWFNESMYCSAYGITGCNFNESAD